MYGTENLLKLLQLALVTRAEQQFCLCDRRYSDLGLLNNTQPLNDYGVAFEELDNDIRIA